MRVWHHKGVKETKNIDDSKRLQKLAPVADAAIKHHVFVCGGKSCSKVGASEVKEAFENELESRGLRYGKEAKGRNPDGEILLTDCGSVGFCSIGTAVIVYPAGIWYAQVRASDVNEIIDEHWLPAVLSKDCYSNGCELYKLCVPLGTEIRGQICRSNI